MSSNREQRQQERGDDDEQQQHQGGSGGRKHQGFAAMPREDVQEIARMGGQSRGLDKQDDDQEDFVPDSEKTGVPPELSGA